MECCRSLCHFARAQRAEKSLVTIPRELYTVFLVILTVSDPRAAGQRPVRLAAVPSRRLAQGDTVENLFDTLSRKENHTFCKRTQFAATLRLSRKGVNVRHQIIFCKSKNHAFCFCTLRRTGGVTEEGELRALL